MRFSIVIPTYNRCDDLLKPCIISLIEHTNLSETEIIVVANGCTDNTMQFMKDISGAYCNIKTLWFDEALGYTKATNEGISEARGEFVLLFNNDCKILPSEKQAWLNRLHAPFSDPGVMATGVHEIYSNEIGHNFLVGYCMMVRRTFMLQFGALDEIFSPGFGEDIDLCARILKHGFSYVNVNFEVRREGNMSIGDFPIYHRGSSTFHENKERSEEYEKVVTRNIAVLTERYSHDDRVTATVSTRGRYFTTLPMCLLSIAMQTRPPDHLIIFDDNDAEKRIDLREIPEYYNIFAMLDRKRVKWEVIFGEGKGQVKNHQKALTASPHGLIWRLDDDNMPEHDVLETLMRYMKPGVGAVGGLVLDPKNDTTPNRHASNKIEDIYLGLNEQWFRPASEYDAKQVDHLYSTFLFRISASPNGYNMTLSKVGHREETIFTYEMKLNGYDVLLTPKCVTWHMCNPQGGIRDNTKEEMWKGDEAVFALKLREWKTSPTRPTVIVLNNGIGDHYAFKSVLPEIRKKHANLTIAATYPDVFHDVDVPLISIADAIRMFGDLSRWDVYGFMTSHSWNRSIAEAFRKMYT
jgi:GT2 family glycosyltransferase